MSKFFSVIKEVADYMPIVLVVFTGLLAYFTFLVKRATDKYTKVTEELLKQSRESSDQSRKAFLANMIGSTMYRATELKLGSKSSDYFARYIKGMYGAVRGIDADLAEELKKGWLYWSESPGKEARDPWSIFTAIPTILKDPVEEKSEK